MALEELYLLCMVTFCSSLVGRLEVKIGVTVCIGILVLGAAGGITYYFQSIFFGFSVATWPCQSSNGRNTKDWSEQTSFPAVCWQLLILLFLLLVLNCTITSDQLQSKEIQKVYGMWSCAKFRYASVWCCSCWELDFWKFPTHSSVRLWNACGSGAVWAFDFASHQRVVSSLAFLMALNSIHLKPSRSWIQCSLLWPPRVTQYCGVLWCVGVLIEEGQLLYICMYLGFYL